MIKQTTIYIYTYIHICTCVFAYLSVARDELADSQTQSIVGAISFKISRSSCGNIMENPLRNEQMESAPANQGSVDPRRATLALHRAEHNKPGLTSEQCSWAGGKHNETKHMQPYMSGIPGLHVQPGKSTHMLVSHHPPKIGMELLNSAGPHVSVCSPAACESAPLKV